MVVNLQFVTDTHGLTAVSDNFSFGDLISYVQFNSAHPLFKNRQIETMAMLMPPCGDYNFIMYENNYYTYNNCSKSVANDIQM